jgi:hypothetical protein
MNGILLSRARLESSLRAVYLNGINCRPAMKPLAPAPSIGSAPLPKGGRFLNHGHTGLSASSSAWLWLRCCGGD